MENRAQNAVKKNKEEGENRMESDELVRSKLHEKLVMCIDPLDPTLHPEGLVNIVTGRVAPEIVNVDKAVELGRKQMKEFEASLPGGFRKPISRTVITMAAAKKKPIRVGDTPVWDTSVIYTRVGELRESRNINMCKSLAHELAYVPTSAFKENGEMRLCTTKSYMKKKLQVEHTSRGVSEPDATILDGCAIFWIIHWPAAGENTSDYAESVLQYVIDLLSSCAVYMIFDKYFKPSIKGQTRAKRGSADGCSRYHVLTLTSELPPQTTVLNNSENKAQLIELVCQYIRNNRHRLPLGHTLVLTSHSSVPVELTCEIEIPRNDLKNTHEEADSIIIHQMLYIAEIGADTIRVICADTDVFLLLMYAYEKHELSCSLTMKDPVSGRTVCDIKASAKKHQGMTDQYVRAHVLSGCDTVSQFFGIGKGKVLKVIRDGLRLNKLGVLDSDMNDVYKEAEQFMLACYGATKSENMSAARYDIWLSKLSKKNLSAAPQLKSLPPTSEAFGEHVKRAHFQASHFLASDKPNPPEINPVEFGWAYDERSKCYDPITLPPDVAPAPVEVLQMIRCGCASERPCQNGKCSCYGAHVKCSVFCACRGLCNNKHIQNEDNEENEHDSEGNEQADSEEQ